MPALADIEPEKGMRVKVFNLDDTEYYGLGYITDVYNGFEPPHCLIKVNDGKEFLDTECDWVDKKNADKIERMEMGRVCFGKKPMRLDDIRKKRDRKPKQEAIAKANEDGNNVTSGEKAKGKGENNETTLQEATKETTED
ncbi:hypothetical protein CH333_03100 [candidate division WOR-3 bacterium JGI_Cruoil_03_44_89]|uniref:Uncharacterized protein n=1 Tax=candidate division WOR-3 bacterium JGI_Cruoil_03_44_89 TaxID=1973748 RepID=A0A235BW09_UNCW3|nr:MAG: hypothetical protein CH333_03100 [candidate division WOR-3 bacterium JGI_Cruoil_03_44_89]